MALIRKALGNWTVGSAADDRMNKEKVTPVFFFIINKTPIFVGHAWCLLQNMFERLHYAEIALLS